MSTMQLRRVDPAQNMARFYTLSVQPTLFGEWCLVREWGRIGRPGTVRYVPYPTLDEAAAACMRLWKAKLKRGYQQRLSNRYA